ncbi:DUF362 domain-containing protein [Roseicitreum antarcticum]|uniref:LarA-like N-terminal domain-containing protein n=1 Tax=Roseicitreum antarcticum TaxID=564137 RepID=A0A1H2YKM6_9RHOB|nr:DUF362 domain-containing protein [Roseicitreum antarcticum]SDX05716.1 protein of unknown function [Roseicitreum antarcticum]
MTSPTFPALHFPLLDSVVLPQVARVNLKHKAGTPVADVPGAVRDAIKLSARLAALRPGSSVAIALGSRGISQIVTVARAAIDTVRDMGHLPFVVPAMGSHGGGTADGQVGVLAKLGLTEEALGVEIRSSMEVVDYGETDVGARCKFDKHAAHADAVIVVNRVKSHTTFDRPIESGLVKMTAVGLGKADGARSVHRTGPVALSDTLPALARIALARSPIALGIALVEDSDKALVAIEGVAPEDFFASDERLLKLAKTFIARLPFSHIDALAVEQIGKDISGAGMDHAVTGRADLRSIPNPPPFVARIAVLGLSKATGGNGLGVGLADFTTVSVASSIDLRQIYMNSLTSTLVEKSRFPIVLANDLDVMRALVSTSWSADNASTGLCIVASTLHLNQVLLSGPLLEQIRQSEIYVSEGPLQDLRFDADGKLLTRAYERDEIS